MCPLALALGGGVRGLGGWVRGWELGRLLWTQHVPAAYPNSIQARPVRGGRKENEVSPVLNSHLSLRGATQEPGESLRGGDV